MELSEDSDATVRRPNPKPAHNFEVGDAPLSVVIVTDKLAKRPRREPDYALENKALVSLAETLANRPDHILSELAAQAQRLAQAHSAGISLMEEDEGEPIFRWHAISGKLAPFINGTMPRFFSPCGEIVDLKAPQLMQHPVRHYPYIAQLGMDLYEVLLVPFSKGEEIIGTVWAVAHDASKVFDLEDLRRLQSLCQFASTAVVSRHNFKALQETSRRLQDTQIRMETALSVGGIATWVWDFEAKQLVADKNLARIFGVKPEDAASSDMEFYFNAIHPDDRAQVRQNFEEAIRSGTTYVAEYRVQVPGQPMRWVSARGELVDDVLHHKQLLTGAVIDITERRKIEDQLRIKTEQLADASKRKDEFLATLSHELRSPLNIIQGHTELLRMETPGTQEFEESLDAIERSAQLQTQLISDMLDVSRIITGKMLLDIAVFNPKEIVMDAVWAIQYAADAKSIALIYDIEEPCGMINGDRGRIQQALWNFLTNAVKFSPFGGKVIIQVRRKNAFIEFNVIDKGQGISPDFLPYVFGRFNQEDGSKSRKHGGLGLGLAIVRHIAELHGGSVHAKSPGKDQGSTFTLSIPVVAVVDDLHAGHSTSEGHADPRLIGTATRLSDYKILVVDDQSDASSLLKRSLELLGASVSIASSADSAWLQLELNRFDILISDIGMPQVNGFDLIKTWRSKERILGRSLMPAIALTAYTTPEDRTEILAAGFTAHLAKPAGLSELAECIVSEIKKHP